VSSDRRAQRDLATTLNRIGLLLADTGRPGEAEAEYRRALAILRDLAEDHSTLTGFRSLLAQVHTNLGALLSELGRPAEAAAEYRAALAEAVR
jgi:tetratricopeptide (TPR) repeat protein